MSSAFICVLWQASAWPLSNSRMSITEVATLSVTKLHPGPEHWMGMAVLTGGDQGDSEIRDRRAVRFSVTFLSRREEMEHLAGDEEDD